MKKTKTLDGIEGSREYQEYTQHECRSFGESIHNGTRFLRLIETFDKEEFDLGTYPIVVSEFAKYENGESLFYILDGSHRAAYVAARHDIMEQDKSVVISKHPGVRHWPNIKKIDFGSTLVNVDDID